MTTTIPPYGYKRSVPFTPAEKKIVLKYTKAEIVASWEEDAVGYCDEIKELKAALERDSRLSRHSFDSQKDQIERLTADLVDEREWTEVVEAAATATELALNYFTKEQA